MNILPCLALATLTVGGPAAPDGQRLPVSERVEGVAGVTSTTPPVASRGDDLAALRSSRISVAPELMASAAKCYRRSPEFRRLLDRLAADSRVVLRVRIGQLDSPSIQGQQRLRVWRAAATGELLRLEGSILLSARALLQPAILGHELKHVEEVLDTGRTLAAAGAGAGVRHGAQGWESRAAQATEGRIASETRRAPLAVGHAAVMVAVKP